MMRTQSSRSWRIRVLLSPPRRSRIPYPDGGAKGFILHVRKMASRDRRNLAITLRDSNELIGMVGYQTKDLESELAYMVSPIHWGSGYASEACIGMVAHIFCATAATAAIARA